MAIHTRTSLVDRLAAPLVPLTGRRLRRILHPLRLKLHEAEGFLSAKGIIVRPLVPERELSACQRHAIDVLMERDPEHIWGDYLEFGVFQGHSLSLMFNNLREANLIDRVRLYGFDSFEGYPSEAANETFNGYRPGWDKAELRVAQKLLTSRGIDWNRVRLVKGWFSDTLTADFLKTEGITRVSLVNFDCDLYVSTKEALTFIGPLVHDAAVFFFDDWGTEEMVNQKRAFAEFLDDEVELWAEELPNYSWESRVFLITRREGPYLPWHERVQFT